PFDLVPTLPGAELERHDQRAVVGRRHEDKIPTVPEERGRPHGFVAATGLLRTFVRAAATGEEDRKRREQGARGQGPEWKETSHGLKSYARRAADSSRGVSIVLVQTYFVTPVASYPRRFHARD